MIRLIKKFFAHELISGASFIFMASLLGNLINFFFNLFMARNLSVSDYGILASMMALMALSTIPAGAILPTVVRFGASYFAKGDLAGVRGLFFKVTKPYSLIAGLIFCALFLSRSLIGQFFHIQDQSLILIVGLMVSIGYAGVVLQPLLQAKLAFRMIALINILASLSKLLFGALLIFIGLGVRGAILAVFTSALITLALSLIPLRFLLKSQLHTPHISARELFSYGVPSAIATFCIMALINSDIILVKHFFDAESAGVYAGLSLVGRVIFFFSATIPTVMFPLIVQKDARQENYHSVFWFSLILVFLPSVIVSIFYFIFPTFAISFFTKGEYTSASNLLGLFAIFITVYSLLFVVTNFFLSIKKTKIFIPIALGAILQASLIWVYHNSFLQVIIISGSISSLLLVLLLLYYWHLYGRKKD